MSTQKYVSPRPLPSPRHLCPPQPLTHLGIDGPSTHTHALSCLSTHTGIAPRPPPSPPPSPMPPTAPHIGIDGPSTHTHTDCAPLPPSAATRASHSPSHLGIDGEASPLLLGQLVCAHPVVAVAGNTVADAGGVHHAVPLKPARWCCRAQMQKQQQEEQWNVTGTVEQHAHRRRCMQAWVRSPGSCSWQRCLPARTNLPPSSLH